MQNLDTAFQLFGTDKVNIRSLVVFRCQFNREKEGSNVVKITRTFKEGDGSLRQEDCDVDYAIYADGGTLHLHDLFVTDSFGLTVSFLEGKGKFEFLEASAEANDEPLVEFRNSSGEASRLPCYIEASGIE